MDNKLAVNDTGDYRMRISRPKGGSLSHEERSVIIGRSGKIHKQEGRKIMKPAMAIGCIVFTVMAACASAPKNVSLAESKGPKGYSYSVSAEEYRIHAGDTLDIKFYFSPELNERVTVRPDGRISLQLADEVPAAGQTSEDLRQALTKIYEKELKKPVITVIVRTFSGQRVYIDGEVQKPGMFPLAVGTTVRQAISQAGGFKDTGRKSNVTVIRQGPEDKPRVIPVDMQKVANGSDLAQDIVLQPYDIVLVPKKTVANINLWLEQYINRNVPQVGFTVFQQRGNTGIGIDTSTR